MNTNYHIEKVSNGFIVTEAPSFRNYTGTKFMESSTYAPPHVFESFDAMQKWLASQFQGVKPAA
jgi:hypothetical protein